MTRRLVLLALVAVALVVAGGSMRMSSAAFTATTTVAGNTITADRLSNYFLVTPGSAVRPGTSTPVASGNVDTLALDFGTVPSVRTFTSVFTVQNVASQPETATLTNFGITQVDAAFFASSGTSSATLAPGASTTVSVTSSATALGLGTGTVRLGLSGSSWLYRNYATTLTAVAQAPGSPSATAKPAGRIDLAWSPSTTLGILGYDVYRSTGGAYTKLNVAPVIGTTYSDTATTNGTAYTYRLRAVTLLLPLESLDSATVGATADTVAPTRPTAVAIANGGGQGSAYINLANRASVSATVTLPASALATDTVTVVASRGAASVSVTVPGRTGAGTVTVTGLDTTAFTDGAVTLTATTADAAGNVSTTRTATVTKDTVAPGAPTGTYTDNFNATADTIAGTTQASATITATRTLPTAAGPYTTVATTGGAYTVTVFATDGSTGSPIAVRYLITATDLAGNTGVALTLNFSVTR